MGMVECFQCEADFLGLPTNRFKFQLIDAISNGRIARILSGIRGVTLILLVFESQRTVGFPVGYDNPATLLRKRFLGVTRNLFLDISCEGYFAGIFHRRAAFL